MTKEKLLEQYTLKNPQQVLLVTAEINQQREEIIIFKGFSSSLTTATAFDPDVPVLPEDSKIIKIDIVKSPFNPQQIEYIEKDLSYGDISQRLG